MVNYSRLQSIALPLITAALDNARVKKIVVYGVMPQDQIRARAIAIAKGEYTPKAGDPKVWFTTQPLSREEQVAFVAALLTPSPPGPRLQKAIERYRKR